MTKLVIPLVVLIIWWLIGYFVTRGLRFGFAGPGITALWLIGLMFLELTSLIVILFLF